jgi:hypothetical protein
MRRILTLALAIAVAGTTSFAAAIVVPSTTPVPSSTVTPAPLVKAADIRIPVGTTGKFINLQELANIKVADLEKLTGKKMRWIDRMQFKLAQRKLRHSINEDGIVTNKKLAAMGRKTLDGETGFHFGGFALGFFLGLIGVLIAYLINDDKKSNRVKWAWIGVGVIVVIVILASI